MLTYLDAALNDLSIQDELDHIEREKNLIQHNLTIDLTEITHELFLEIYPIQRFKEYSSCLPHFEKIKNVECLDYLKIETLDLLKKKDFLENLFINKDKNLLFLSNLLSPETKDILVNILSNFEKNVLINDKEIYSVINILTYLTFNLENPFDFKYSELMQEVQELINCYQDNQNNQENISSYYNSIFNKKFLIISSSVILSGLLISLGFPSKIGSVLIKSTVKSYEL